MLRVSKKLIASLFAIIVVFNLIGSSYINFTYAATDIDFEDVITVITNVMGGIVSICMWPLRIKATVIAVVINVIEGAVATMDNTAGTTKFFITPYDIFFNKIPLLDIDIFDISGSGVLSDVRGKVAEWYYAMRVVAVGALLVVLGFIGINMAISTMADDKAKYKRMLVDWVASVAILFLLHYIMIFIIMVNNALVNAIDSYVSDTTMAGFNDDTIQDAFSNMAMKAMVGIGVDSLTATIVFALLVFQTAGFIVSYLNRMIKVCFLIIISPLITITYSIDKIKDQKSQALDGWLKEFSYSILIQPFHCIIYATFISIAFTLIGDPTQLLPFDDVAKVVSSDYNQLVAGLYAIFACTFIYTAEKLVRKIFNISDDASKTSMAAGVAVSVAAVANAKKIGAGTKKGLNMAADAAKKAGESAKVLGEKAGRFADRLESNGGKLGAAVSTARGAAKSAGGKISGIAKKGKGAVKKGVGKVKASDKYKKFASGMDKLTGGLNNVLKAPKNLNDKLAKIAGDKTQSKSKRFFANVASRSLASIRSANSTGNVARLLGASAMLGAGRGPLEAIGAGAAIGEGYDSFMSSTTGAIADDASGYKGAYDDVPDNARASELKGQIKDLDKAKEEADKASEEAKDAEQAVKDNLNREAEINEQLNTNTNMNPTQREALQREMSELLADRDGLKKKAKDAQDAKEAARKKLAGVLGKSDTKNLDQDYDDKRKALEHELEDEKTNQYAEFYDQILQQGKVGRFADGTMDRDKSTERRALELSVQNELKDIDLDGETESVITSIYDMAAKGMKTEDICEAVRKELERSAGGKASSIDFSRLESAVGELGSFQEQANLFKSLSVASGVSLSTTSLAREVARREVRGRNQS